MAKNSAFITLSVKGHRDLERKLKRLSSRVHKKIVRGALAKGARVIAKQAKANAPVGKTKQLKKSIGRAARSNVQAGFFYEVIGPVKGKGGSQGHILEYGSAPRATKGGASRGRVPARPFLRPAVLQTKGRVRRIIRGALRAGIHREAAKLR